MSIDPYTIGRESVKDSVGSGGGDKAEIDKDNDVINYVVQLRNESQDYRNQFKTTWDLIEDQIRCVHPSSWDKKEDWQTKVYIGLQAKTSETAFSYLNKMIFGIKRFFNIEGIRDPEKAEDDTLMTLYEIILDRGRFWYPKDFQLQEACDQGTSFMKVLINKAGDGMDFIWRSCYQCFPDPSARYDFYRSRYFIDEVSKSMVEIVGEIERNNSLYKPEAVKELLEYSQRMSSNEGESGLENVRGIDGTSYKISKKLTEVKITEFWGKVKKVDEKGNATYEDKVVTIANDKIELRSDKNPYGQIPFFPIRIKKRKYDLYGKGFIENTMDLQDLANSCVNLGFDSLKISSMDIIVIDENKISDPASIEYRPLATWKMKSIDGVKIQRQPISALNDVLRGLQMIDQIHQDVSSVVRAVQGTGGAGGEETLGEYQLKLAAIDQRFLNIAKFVEADFIVPLLQFIYKILSLGLLDQNAINRLLGTRSFETVNPITGQPEKTEIPKLDIGKIIESGDMSKDFRAVGINNFTNKTDQMNKLREMMKMVIASPMLGYLTKIEKLWVKLLQAGDVEDYQDMIRTREEFQDLMNSMPQNVAIGQGGEMPNKMVSEGSKIPASLSASNIKNANTGQLSQ